MSEEASKDAHYLIQIEKQMREAKADTHFILPQYEMSKKKRPKLRGRKMKAKRQRLGRA